MHPMYVKVEWMKLNASKLTSKYQLYALASLCPIIHQQQDALIVVLAVNYGGPKGQSSHYPLKRFTRQL